MQNKGVPETQTAVVVNQYDAAIFDRSATPSYSTLRLEERPVPMPGSGQVNPTDLIQISGTRPNPAEPPIVPGSEGVGKVISQGKTAEKLSVGQRVVGAPWPGALFKNDGTWQQFVLASESDLVAVPDSVEDHAAAQFYVNPITAYAMIEVLAVPKGEYLLQTAANSALGRQVIALAKDRGIKTINVIRNAAQEKDLKALGADEVVVTSGEDTLLADRVHDITGGKGAYAAIECVGGELTRRVTNSVRAKGTVLIYGQFGGDIMHLNIMDLLCAHKEVKGFQMPVWLNQLPAKQRAEVLNDVMALLERKVFQPPSGPKFPLSQFKEAMEASKQASSEKVFLEG